ncbi:MAG: Na(+)-translocating NADH-quinone reductase subunit F [Flavobacterium sp.]
MKTTQRFDQAITKLYHAFQKGTLHPESCTQCAVGNILDNKDSWKHLSNAHGSTELNYVGIVNQNLGKRFNGYSPIELLQIEMAFLRGCGYSLPLRLHQTPKRQMNNDVLFKGLEAVVAQLCGFDNLPNIMDCSKLFHYDSKQQIAENKNVVEVIV